MLQNVEICKLLLEYGAEPKVHGGERNVTPLHVAVQNDFIDAIPLLIQFGADIHAQAKVMHLNLIDLIRLIRGTG